MTLKEIDALGDWMDGLVTEHRVSLQLTSVWLAQRGLTAPRPLSDAELADLIRWARVL